MIDATPGRLSLHLSLIFWVGGWAGGFSSHISQYPMSAKFMAAQAFEGSKEGYVYKMGQKGLGYYFDVSNSTQVLSMSVNRTICNVAYNSTEKTVHMPLRGSKSREA